MINERSDYVNTIMILELFFFVALFLFCFSLNTADRRPGRGSSDRVRLLKRRPFARQSVRRVNRAGGRLRSGGGERREQANEKT
jgi:hypothetical protein